MAKINIKHPYSLSPQEAAKKLDELAGTLGKKYKMGATWASDRVARVTGNGVKGTIEIGDKTINVGIDLPLLLSPLQTTIQNAIIAELKTLFG
jgi:putative polyhydroxyalkanoate system protein